MKRLDAPLITPIYAKTSPDEDWPDEPTFYLLTSNGIFLCRNDRFYQSAVRAQRPLSELAQQQQFLIVNFPLIPQTLLEQAVGFFDWAYYERGAESVLLLAWDEQRQEVELIAPEQVASSYRNARGDVFAESVRYEFPHPPAEGLVIFGDIHCHCDMSAYASAMDQADEVLFNGLHIVVGWMHQEPPQWHIEAVVDGVRFAVARDLVCEGYHLREPSFPPQWRARHSVKYTGYQASTSPATGTYSYDANRDAPAPQGGWPGSNGGQTTWGGKPLTGESYSSAAAADDPALPAPTHDPEEPSPHDAA